MESFGLLKLIFIMALISGCASISTSSDYMRGADFSNLKTYDWVPGAQPVAGDARIDNQLTDSRIRRAVDNALAVKGFVKSPAGTPDFLVAYQAAIEGKLDVTTIDIPYTAPTIDARGNFRGGGSFHGSQFAYGGAETFVSQYEEGSVFIDIVNPKTNELMWRGTGKATVLEKATPEKREARINEGVEKILAQFPPS